MAQSPNNNFDSPLDVPSAPLPASRHPPLNCMASRDQDYGVNNPYFDARRLSLGRRLRSFYSQLVQTLFVKLEVCPLCGTSRRNRNLSGTVIRDRGKATLPRSKLKSRSREHREIVTRTGRGRNLY